MTCYLGDPTPTLRCRGVRVTGGGDAPDQVGRQLKSMKDPRRQAIPSMRWSDALAWRPAPPGTRSIVASLRRRRVTSGHPRAGRATAGGMRTGIPYATVQGTRALTGLFRPDRHGAGPLEGPVTRPLALVGQLATCRAGATRRPMRCATIASEGHGVADQTASILGRRYAPGSPRARRGRCAARTASAEGRRAG